jgi:membrane protease YdiL (CAAX protease family)
VIWRIFLALVFASLFGGVGLIVLVRLPPVVGLLWALGLGAAFLWWHVRRGGPRRRALVRLRRPRGSQREIAVAAASTLLIALGVSGLIGLLLPPLQDLDLGPWERILAYQRTVGGWLALTSFVALVVPIVEEFCFRGHIQHTLERRYAPWVAILVTTVLFTLAHLGGAHWSVLLLPMALGLGMGVATVLFQSIWVAVGVHGAWNAAMSMAGGLSSDAPAVGVEQQPLILLSLVVLALGLGGWFSVLRDGRYRVLLAPPARGRGTGTRVPVGRVNG